MRKVLLGGLIVIVAFGAALFAMNWFAPSAPERRPALADSPPLKPATRTSVVVAPVAIALSAIRDALEAQAPRDLSGKRENPLGQLLQNAELGWTMARGPLAIAGRPEGLTVAAPLNGTFRLTGQIGAQVGNQVGNITGALGGLLNDQLGKQMGNLTGRALDQRADVRGNVLLAARPALTPNWRLEPNLTGQAMIGDANLSIAAVKLNLSREVKPLLDRAVAEQVNALQARLRNDPMIEQAARREWAKMCRAIPLGKAARRHAGSVARSAPAARGRGAAEDRCRGGDAHGRRAGRDAHLADREQAGLSVPGDGRDRAADGAGPRIGRRSGRPAVHRGEQADRSAAQGKDISRGQERRRRGDDPARDRRAVRRSAAHQPARQGERKEKLVRLRRAGRRPCVGQAGARHRAAGAAPDRHQLDVQSEEAFGLLSAAARAAIPYLKDALAENARIDLKPFAANARKSIEAALADFRTPQPGVQVDTAITELRLAGIEFDAKTLRIIAEAEGSVKVAVSALPGR